MYKQIQLSKSLLKRPCKLLNFGNVRHEIILGFFFFITHENLCETSHYGYNNSLEAAFHRSGLEASRGYSGKFEAALESLEFAVRPRVSREAAATKRRHTAKPRQR